MYGVDRGYVAVWIGLGFDFGFELTVWIRVMYGVDILIT